MDRMTMAALLDRIMFGDAETFRADDARELWQLLKDTGLPHRSIFRFSFFAKLPGKSFSGFSPGIGNVDIKGNQRTYEYDTQGRAILRVGQWKIFRNGQHVDITQVMSNKQSRLAYTNNTEPACLLFGKDTRITLHIPFWPGKSVDISFIKTMYEPWKRMI